MEFKRGEEEIKSVGEIIMYGERGIVNAIVAYLMDPTASIERCREFFSVINWGENNGKIDWISRLQNVDAVVEVGLGQFGDPDLIFVCTLNDHTKKYIFIEAKVVPYVISAISNSEGMRTRGFNSSINGQLSLKYRFVQALKLWNGKTSIIEPEEQFSSYREHLNDSKSNPRLLAKKSILANILKRIGLYNINPENCYFVALTNDKEPGPFVKVAEEYLPCILNNNGKNIWGEVVNQFGWIGFDILPEGLQKDECYTKAFGSTVCKFIHIEGASMEGRPDLKTNKLKVLPYELQTGISKVATSSQEIFTKEYVKRRTGSYSITLNNRTVIKIAPKKKDDQNVYIGITPQFRHVYEKFPIAQEFNFPFSMNKKPFDGMAIHYQEIEKRLPEIEEVFEAIYEEFWNASDSH